MYSREGPEGSSTFLWDVTSKCNLRCIHCYNTVKYPRSGIQEELDTEKAKEAISKIHDFGFKHVHLLGGEPLVRNDIFELIEYARSYNIEVTINSNGTILDENKIRRLIELGVAQFTFSLDGATGEINDKIRGLGTFRKVVNNIKLFQKIKQNYKNSTEVSIAYTLTAFNLHQMKELIELIIGLGIDALDVMDLYLSGEALDRQKELIYTDTERISAYEKLAKSYWKNRDKLYSVTVQVDTQPSLAEYLNRKYDVDLAIYPRNVGCGAGTQHWLMEADGRINPCGMVDNAFYNKEPVKDGILKIENINIKDVNSLDEVLYSDYFQSFFKFKEQYGRANRQPCSECSFKDICVQCPFLYYRTKLVRECQEVMKDKEAFIENFRNQLFILNKERLKENTDMSVYDPILNEYRRINDMGKIIVHRIEQYKTPNEIGKWLQNEVEGSIEQNKILEDICFFIHHLILLGVIEKK